MEGKSFHVVMNSSCWLLLLLLLLLCARRMYEARAVHTHKEIIAHQQHVDCPCCSQ